MANELRKLRCEYLRIDRRDEVFSGLQNGLQTLEN